MSDPRHADTVEEACANKDGTYNGLRLLSFLSEALNPGKGLSEADVKKEWDKVVAEKRRSGGLNE